MIEEDPLIYAVDIANPALDPTLLTKSLFIFGEHSRELISSDTGLHLLLQLCGEEPTSIDIDTILQTNQFRMVLNSNPAGRKMVESGQYCQRTNENGVDLNRNWDAHWEAVIIGSIVLELNKFGRVLQARTRIQVQSHSVNQRRVLLEIFLVAMHQQSSYQYTLETWGCIRLMPTSK